MHSTGVSFLRSWVWEWRWEGQAVADITGKSRRALRLPLWLAPLPLVFFPVFLLEGVDSHSTPWKGPKLLSTFSQEEEIDLISD